MIGFHRHVKTLVKSVSVAALTLLCLVGTPSPAQGQHEKEQKEQTHKQGTMKGGSKNEDRQFHGGNRGYEGRGRITEGRFNQSFGEGHRFRVNEGEFGAGFFGYGGFEFGFLDPWPAYWAYTDDVYVDYVDGGYVLVNPIYPGVTIGLTLR
jgi:hypothetical protein